MDELADVDPTPTTRRPTPSWMSDVQQSDKLEKAEAWWAFILRIGAAIFGAWLIYGQSTVPNPPGAQVWILVVGVGCMGPAIAAPVAAMIEALRGSGTGGGGPA